MAGNQNYAGFIDRNGRTAKYDDIEANITCNKAEQKLNVKKLLNRRQKCAI